MISRSSCYAVGSNFEFFVFKDPPFIKLYNQAGSKPEVSRPATPAPVKQAKITTEILNFVPFTGYELCGDQLLKVPSENNL